MQTMELIGQAGRGLHSLDYGIILVYMAAVLALGWHLGRKHKKGEDFFLAGRKMPWFAVGLSLVATLLSTLTYLAAPGEVIQHGLALAIGWLGLPIAFVVVNFVWIPFFMRLRVTSIYEYLERRFGLAARWTAAALFVFVLRLLWMAAIVFTASAAVAQITYPTVTNILGEISPGGWTLTVLLSVGILATVYTMIGGITAVIWTDVIQFIVLFAGLIFTLVFVAIDTGSGPVDWWKTTTESAGGGHEFPALFSFDLTDRNVILFTLLSMVFWYTCTFIADQVAVQRYLTIPTVREAIRGNIVQFVADFFIMIMLAACGMALLHYYLDPAFQAEIFAGITDPTDPRVADKVFPHFIANGLPIGVSGLVVAALFAVAMSSIDSGVNSVATVLTIDFVKRTRPAITAQAELRLARIFSLVVGLACTAMAILMLAIPENYNIIGITLRTFNCALGPMGGLFILGIFLPRVSQKAALIATFVGLGIAVWIAWCLEIQWLLGLTEFASFAEMSDAVVGPSPFLITPTATVSTILLGWLLSFLLPNQDLERARKLTWKAVTSEKNG
jgi:SSS family solute:Na+ symporter